MGGISDLFAGFGHVAKAKLVILGSSERLLDQICSLNFEHVSPVRLKGLEISRRPVSAVVEEANTLALMRRWFFARKPDAGFILTEFPATLLQAKVFDEWLEARNETLNGVFISGQCSRAIEQHYCTLGLIIEVGNLAS